MTPLYQARKEDGSLWPNLWIVFVIDEELPDGKCRGHLEVQRR